MIAFTIRRLAGSVPTLLIVITIAFFMMRVAPGGPFDIERALPPDIEENILAAYNLDQPLWAQYFDYLWGVLHGDLGPSYKFRDFTVSELIASGLPVSFQLGGTAILLAIVIGTSIGTLAALRQNSGTDYAIMSVARNFSLPSAFAMKFNG